MSAVQAIIAKWKSPAEFGRDIGLTRYNHAHLMKMRMSIPPLHWPKVVQASEERGYGITFEMLAEAHSADAELRLGRRKEVPAARTSASPATPASEVAA